MGMPTVMASILATGLSILTYLATAYGKESAPGMIGFGVMAATLIILWFIYFVIARIVVGLVIIRKGV